MGTLWRYLSRMPAHYKRSKHLISIDWFRLWLSPVFENAACTNAPEGVDREQWSRQWTAPETPAIARAAMDRCIEDCPALLQCRALVSLGSAPRGVIQAGHAYGVRVGPANRRVASRPTTSTEAQEPC